MSFTFRVALHDTDTAGVMFFGHLFRHLHDAYEHWMDGLGFPIDALIREREILLPLSHAEADFRAPLRHGDQVRIELALLELETTRFTLAYRCLTGSATLSASALTRHCCIDPERHQPTDLPAPLAQALELQMG